VTDARTSSSPPVTAAGLAWAGDALGAALFALGLALAVTGAAGLGEQPAWLPALAMLAGALLRWGAQALAAELGMGAAMHAKAALRAAVLPGVLATAHARGRMAGEAVVEAVDAIEMQEGFHARYRPARLAAGLAPLLVAALVALASPVSAAILLGTLLPFIAGLALAGTAARAAATRQLDAIGHLGGLFLDRLRALAEVRHFRAEERVTRHLAQASAGVAQRTVATLRIAFLSGGIIEFFAAIAVALVAVYAGFQLLGLLPVRIAETLTLGAAFFALAMAPEFYLPMRRLAAAYHERQQGEAARDTLAAVPALVEPHRAERFDGLTARALVAGHAEGPAIGPLDLAIPPCGLVALVGPTGSGKSTLLATLAGALTPRAGRLDWAAGAPPAIGWAGQRPLLVAGTLGENVALLRPDASASEVEAAARAALLGPVLSGRGGLAALLDWRGSGLSGGERRRIGLARALLSGRPLLLIDEPTADLDAATAAHIRALLAEVARERAVVVATHDAALAAMSDVRVALA
jgi:ATP-binding cassette subfamily C protein CydD